MQNKKFATSLIMGGLIMSAALVGCNNGDGESVKEDDKIINLQLVPSNSPSTLLTNAQKLTPILEKLEPGYTFNISVSTSYASAATALWNGQLDGAFLPAGNYAQVTEEHPGKIDVLLSATRAGYKVQADDFPGFDDAAKENQRNAMNGKNGYDYKGQQSATKVSYYSSIMMCLRDEKRVALGKSKLDLNNDGEVTIEEIKQAGATVGHMDVGSSAGYNYPSKYLVDHGFTKGFVDGAKYDALSEEDKKLAVKGVITPSYPSAVDGLMDGTYDVVCGFMDIRYGSAYVQATSKYNHDDSLFTDTYTVAITDPIFNDTLSVYKNIAPTKRAAIADAFKKAVEDGKIDEEDESKRGGAYYLYQIYSHTGYSDAEDANYDSARQMYNWMKDNHLA